MIVDNLAKYATSLSYADLSPQVRHEVKRKLLDSISCALGSKAAAPIRAIKALVLKNNSVEMTAFLYSAMSRYLDWMDTYYGKEFAHPSDNIGAILAAAEAVNSRPQDVMAAISVAYDVQCNLADAANLRDSGFDHTLYVGIASAAGLSNLLRLTREQARNALAIAAVSGLSLRQSREGKLSNWKGFAAAHAARNGLFSVLLAKEGITGPEAAFEGEKGLFSVLGKFSLNLKRARILDCSIKLHNVETQAQSALDAALELRKKLRGEIKAIEVEIWRRAIEIIADRPKWNPQNRETADHSLPYMVAVALLYGKVTPEYYAPQYLKNSEIRNLMSKIKIKENKAFTKEYPKSSPTTVRIKTATAKFEATVRYHKGHPRNPLSDKELEEKFNLLTKNKKPGLLRWLWNLEQQSSLAPLFEALK